MGIALREPWRTRLLWASIAGNLFLGGLVGAHFALRPRMGSPGLAGAAERMARTLPSGDAARFRTVMDREKPWYDIARHRMTDARADVSRAIAHEPYDEAAVRASLLAFQARWDETNLRFGESLLVAIGTLSPEGRARLAASNDGPGRR